MNCQDPFFEKHRPPKTVANSRSFLITKGFTGIIQISQQQQGFEPPLPALQLVMGGETSRLQLGISATSR